MTDVKMPKPVDLHAGVYGYTEAQTKQYGDDRAREALEIAAKKCEEVDESSGDADECAAEVRALAKEIK